MNRQRTHTVINAYRGRDGQSRVYVKDHPLPLLCDELLNEGDSVVIVGDRAERPNHHQQGAA
ncbi:hypothetical protein [Brevundimonas vesicularis]|uniref:hypothetical protein n=1 Tax=Brevundimonas vesicularis TaxID=41276 RepID=UPI00384F777C